jgi:hypothetical protein
MSGRFYAACLIIGWQIFSMQGGISIDKKVFATTRQVARPEICRPAQPGEISAAARFQQLQSQSEIPFDRHSTSAMFDRRRTAASAADYRRQASLCAADERPTEGYIRQVSTWSAAYRDNIWLGVMPMLMLFLGIMIAVGPPFSGESAEASTLTFSLPWSRSRWLLEKVKLSSLCIIALVAPVYVASATATNFPEVAQLSNVNLYAPTILTAIPCIITGIVGVALGVTATMLTRSALAGAVCASMVAYLLTMVNISGFVPNAFMDSFALMDVTEPAGMFVALAVIIGAILLTHTRLENTDF